MTGHNADIQWELVTLARDGGSQAGITLSNVEEINSGEGNDTLTAETVNDWQITAGRAGQVDAAVFEGIENIVGASHATLDFFYLRVQVLMLIYSVIQQPVLIPSFGFCQCYRN